ncbi:MAG: UDP-N-acetyl glucosamine 2-epimerase [Prevotella sp.]|nr:UDP-N-acetyl glucosamine 2-epimerase [Prevotella sp.]MBR4369056.1 UDP-N-acetyl glucosamine 2-epimerase [Prevotella sp.]MBR7048932.1 UDP-N-acetyl glucosamine 2-epimerase [Prevotella sp.]
MNICIFAGARPNFIKVAPVIRAIQAKNSSPLRGERGESFTFLLVYAGCEDDPTLEGSLFDDLQIARPDVYLGVDCENLNELTGQVMSKFELFLQQHPVDAVIVVDDLASTMAAAIVTKKQGILLAHLAAGTRSFDISMPKEINRLVIDGLSDILFTAGISNNSIANKEGAELSKVYMVGNILIDNIRYNQSRWVRPAVLDELGIADGEYIVFTLNRKALIADCDNLRKMLVAMLQHSNGVPIIAPLRKTAVDAIMSLALREQLGEMHHFHIVPPLNYLEFGWLTSHAMGIITDSGNVAEEATFNGVPCITLNSYTEHIETVKQGSNVLVGEDAGKLAAAIKDMVTGNWKPCGIPDRWDGRTAERILQILLERR